MKGITTMGLLVCGSYCNLSAAHPIDSSLYISSVDSSLTPADAIPNAQRETFVHLFNWKYSEIEKECAYLGLNGFKAVQISPPNESLTFANNPWWQSYQPLSYNIKTRFGDRAALQSLSATCAKWGVDIYADCVINHMGGGSESQFAATYPNAENFHHPICQIQDYCDHQQVRFCQLSGLNDLATDTEPVRAKIAAYLNDLLSLGVTGFRFDASKHMWPADLQSIVGRLNKNHYNQAPPLFQEVIRGPACEITPDEYFNTSPVARVTEFLYATNVAGKVSANAIADLVTFPIGQSWGMVPDNKAVVFIDNHDTERHAAPLTYKSGPKYYLATAFMLAWPYGFPKVLSGFLFTDIDAGSPSTSSGDIAANDCSDPNGNLWTCTHRFRPVAAASQFRAVTSGSNTVSNIYTVSGNANVVGFSRSGKGYIFFNGGATATTVTVQTGLPAGFYCDVASGDLTPTGCSGAMVEVSSTGSATFTANGSNIVVIHIKSKTDQSCVTSKTCNSCSVFGYKQDCGYAGVTQSDCLAKNCCWIPSNIPNQPWCFSHNHLQSAANLRGYAAELM